MAITTGTRVWGAEGNCGESEGKGECYEGEAGHTHVSIIHSCRCHGAHGEASGMGADEDYGDLVDSVVHHRVVSHYMVHCPIITDCRFGTAIFFYCQPCPLVSCQC